MPGSLWNPKVHFLIHKTPALLPILIVMNQVNANPSYVRSFVISSHLYQGLTGGLLPVSTPSHWYRYCFILFFVEVVTFCVREVRWIWSERFSLSLVCIIHLQTYQISYFGRYLHFKCHIPSSSASFTVAVRPKAKGSVRSSAKFFFFNFTLCKSIAVTKFHYFFLCLLSHVISGPESRVY
jgi:hypothetical protein